MNHLLWVSFAYTLAPGADWRSLGICQQTEYQSYRSRILSFGGRNRRQMRLYAIKKPGSLLLMAFAYDRGGSWLRFLDNKPHHVYHDSPNTTFDEAVRAYEAIGYKCIALECEEAQND